MKVKCIKTCQGRQNKRIYTYIKGVVYDIEVSKDNTAHFVSLEPVKKKVTKKKVSKKK